MAPTANDILQREADAPNPFQSLFAQLFDDSGPKSQTGGTGLSPTFTDNGLADEGPLNLTGESEKRKAEDALPGHEQKRARTEEASIGSTPGTGSTETSSIQVQSKSPVKHDSPTMVASQQQPSRIGEIQSGSEHTALKVSQTVSQGENGATPKDSAASKINASPPKPPTAVEKAKAQVAAEKAAAAAQRRRTEATGNMAEFNMNHRFRLEDAAKKGENRFAEPLLKVFEHMEREERLREEVVSDPAQFDITRRSYGFQGDASLFGLSVKNWLSLEAREPSDPSYSDAWLEANTLNNIVVLDQDKWAKGAYFCDIGVNLQWLSREIETDDQERNLKVALAGVAATGQRPFIKDSTYPFPAADMPQGTKRLILPLNTGVHWITVMMEPNFDTKQGRITFFDSLDAESVKRRVKRIMPLFASLISARPSLDWFQESWTVTKGQTTIQHNSHDCGPITGHNCSRLMRGLAPEVVEGSEKSMQHGSDLRYECLRRFYPLFMNEALSSAYTEPPKALKKGKANVNVQTPFAAKPSAPVHTNRDVVPPSPADDDLIMDDANYVQDPAAAESLFIPDFDDDNVGFEGSNDNLSETSRYIMGDREHLCNALCQGETLSLDEIVARVLHQKAEDEVDVESLAKTLKEVLERTSLVFDWSWYQGERRYFLKTGYGISMDSSTNNRLRYWQPGPAVKHALPASDFTISGLRYSGMSRTNRAENAKARASALFDAHWERYGDYHTAKPSKIETSQPAYPGWTDFIREFRSSTSFPFEGRTAERRIRELLDNIDKEGRESGQPKTVLLLGNGFDGWTTANNEWKTIRDRWRFVHFTIALAIPSDCGVDGLFDQGGPECKWSHYDLGTLVRLYGSARGGFDPSTVEGCDRAHHEQFLWICQAINSWKIDCSITGSVAVRPKLVRHLTTKSRNTFYLSGDDDRQEQRKVKREANYRWSEAELQCFLDAAHLWWDQGRFGDPSRVWMFAQFQKRIPDTIRKREGFESQYNQCVAKVNALLPPRLGMHGCQELCDWFIACAHEDWKLAGKPGAIPHDDIAEMIWGRFIPRYVPTTRRGVRDRIRLSPELTRCRDLYEKSKRKRIVGAESSESEAVNESGDESDESDENTAGDDIDGDNSEKTSSVRVDSLGGVAASNQEPNSSSINRRTNPSRRARPK